MSATPQDILSTFDVLPEPDQRFVAAEILRRAAHWESPLLSDEELCCLADESFCKLDKREANNGDAPAR